MKQKKSIFNFFVNRNWKKITDRRKRGKILADNRKSHHPIETLVSWLFDWSKNTRKMKSNLKKIHCLSCSWWEVDHKRRNKSSLIQPVAELVAVNSWKGSGVEKHEIHFKRGLVYPYIKWPEEFWRRYQKTFTRER